MDNTIIIPKNTKGRGALVNTHNKFNKHVVEDFWDGSYYDEEFLNNSIKHGNATEINININQNKEEITLSISDNGVGFNIDEVTTFKGYGLKNIKNRVESFNGDLKINSVQNQGTTFNIKIPTIF